MLQLDPAEGRWGSTAYLSADRHSERRSWALPIHLAASLGGLEASIPLHFSRAPVSAAFILVFSWRHSKVSAAASTCLSQQTRRMARELVRSSPSQAGVLGRHVVCHKAFSAAIPLTCRVTSLQGYICSLRLGRHPPFWANRVSL